MQMWQPLKNMYSNYKLDTDIQLNDSFVELTTKVHYNANDTNHEDVTIMINGSSLVNKNETDHFIIQHFRIPTMVKSPLPLVKLLQIAYNIGQAKAEFEKKTYDDRVISFYKEHKLDSLNTYIDRSLFDKPIIAMIQTGGYYDKYMRYKRMYLALKN
jgi:hypothetical protein